MTTDFDEVDPAELMEKLMQSLPEPDLEPVIGAIRKLDRMKAAATFGGLLIHPGLQSNCHRLEFLCHMAVRFAHGQQKPTREFTIQAFNTIGEGSIGRQEDPAENLFVSLVSTSKGNFRILPGIFEGAGFYLQSFLDVLESMPGRSPFNSMRSAVLALLRLSEAVADRAGLLRNSLGESIPLETIPSEVLEDIGRLRKWVTFSNNELARLGVHREQLGPFIFDQNMREALDGYMPGHSDLERHPLLADRSSIVVALPTAISAAIRRFLIEECQTHRMENTLALNLGQVHAKSLRDSSSFGGPHSFSTQGGFLISNTLREIDKGHWLHVLAFVDDFHGYANAGLVGLRSGGDDLSKVLQLQIKEYADHARSQDGYREGISLLIPCGWGRGISLPAVWDDTEGWIIECIGLHDLKILAGIPNYTPTDLWKTISMTSELNRLGVELLNPNGLLNLVAWERHLGGHQVPHPEMPSDMISHGHSALIAIPTNQVRDLRAEAARTQDFLRLPTRDGQFIPVCRTGPSLFTEDDQYPTYGAYEEAKRRRLLGAFVSPSRVWWLEAKSPNYTPMLFKHWEMLLHWMSRSTSVLEAICLNLPKSSITWIVEFEEMKDSIHVSEISKIVDPWSLFPSLITNVDHARATVLLSIPDSFRSAYFFPENHAERMLVQALVEATLILGGKSISKDDLVAIIHQIIPNPDARHIHMGHGQDFRDRVMSSMPEHFVAISKQDDARIKLGLGKPDQTLTGGGMVNGVDACKNLLNDTVSRLEAELCSQLKKYNRSTFVEKVLLNHEVAAVDQARWRRTAGANIALHSDIPSAMNVILEQEGARNAVFLASRILIEAAICECPEAGGYSLGDIDLSKLMAIASSIFHYGGMSDAIHRGVKAPEIHISPLGDILSKPQFEDEVLIPFGRIGSEQQVTHSIKNYDRQYQIQEPVKEIEDRFDTEFVMAWREEFKYSIDEGRKICDLIEIEGETRDTPAFFISREELINTLLKNGIEDITANAFLESMTLPTRVSWMTIPDGFLPRDRDPWRFRRRLSLMRRPLIQLSDSQNPLLMVAPGLLRDIFFYLLRGFHEGAFPDKHYPTSQEMRSWIGIANDRRGIEFNHLVCEQMKKIGWTAVSDLQVTELLKRGFGNINYGDVDVFAWNSNSKRVLIIECKDLHFPKTPGEVADQLTEFLGERDRGGKRDSLLKHLDRFNIISEHIEDVIKFTKMSTKPILESHIVFRHPVPMQFAWKELASHTSIHAFDSLELINDSSED